jgi:hypothetical protein
MQVEERWDKLLSEKHLGAEQEKSIRSAIEQMKRSLYLGKDPEILAGYNRVPEALKNEWVDLLYIQTDRLDAAFLDKVVRVLEDPSLNLPLQEKCRKTLTHLKTLSHVMGQLEDNINVVLQQVLNGGDNVLSNGSAVSGNQTA